MRFITFERLTTLYTYQELNYWLGLELGGKYGEQNRGEIISLLRRAIQYKRNHAS